MKSSVCLLSLALVAVLGVGCSPAAKKARHLERADKFFAASDYDKAEIEYLNVLRFDVDNARAFSQLGVIYAEQGRFGRAVPALLKAQQLNPSNLVTRLKLGRVYLAGGKFKDARTEAEFVLAQQPQDDEAPLLLADTAITSNLVAETKTQLAGLAQQVPPRAAVQVALGRLEMRFRDYKAAEAAFQAALKIDPKSSAAHSALGDLCWIQNDLPRAEAAYKTAAELAPARSTRRMLYAQFKIQNGDAATGRRMLEEITQKTPDYLPAWSALAQIAINEKRYADCDAIVEKMLMRDPWSYDSLFLSGSLQMGKGEKAKAVAAFEKLVKAYPQAAAAYHQLALACLANNEGDKAVSALNQAVSLNADFPDAVILLAGLRLRRGEISPAVIALRQLTQQRPQLFRAQLLLADAYRAQGNLDDALNVYRALAVMFPKNPQPQLLAGLVCVQQRKKDEARAAFSKALEIAPDYSLALEQLVDLDLADKRFDAALQRVRSQIEKTPKLSDLQLLLAKIYLTQRDTTQAEAALLKAIEFQPDLRVAYVMLARLYVDTKQHEKALQRLQTVVDKNPKDSGGLLLIAMIHDIRKNREAARDAYEKLLAVNPKSSMALNNLAWLCSEHFNQLDKALEMATRAHELLPNDPSTADTLGWVLSKKGQYAQALTLLQDSVNKSPADPEIQFHLGATYYMLGETARARAALQAALQSGRDFAGREEAAQRLAALAFDLKTAGPETRAALEKQAAEHPDDTIAIANLGALYDRDGDAAKALGAYRSVLRTSPRNVHVMIKLAELYQSRLNDLPQSLELAKAAYKIAPEDANVGYALGRLAFRAGDFKWSQNLLKQVANKRENDPDVLYDLALASYSVGQVAEAGETMQAALKTGAAFARAADAKRFLELVVIAGNPKADATGRVEEVLKSEPANIAALVARAALLDAGSDIAAARQAHEKVLSVYTEFAPSKRRLAILYAADDKLQNPKAYDVAAAARKAFPSDPEVARAFGIASYRQGDFARAINLLRESNGKLDADARAFYYLGMAQLRLQQRAESKRSLERVLTLNPSAALAAETQKALDELK